jgi:hypothetical protein
MIKSNEYLYDDFSTSEVFRLVPNTYNKQSNPPELTKLHWRYREIHISDLLSNPPSLVLSTNDEKGLRKKLDITRNFSK